LEHWKVTDIAAWLCAIALTVLLGFGVQRWRAQRMTDPWLRLMGQARQQLLQAGITHASHLGPRGLAQAAQAQWGDESRPLQQWLLQMEQWRYAPHSAQTPSLAALRRSYRALIWPRPRTP
jgi:hypothetical protein